jgi:hypothetical protein
MDQNDFGIVRALFQRAQEQPGARNVRLPQDTAKVYLSTMRRLHDQKVYARLTVALGRGLDAFTLACEAIFDDIAREGQPPGPVAPPVPPGGGGGV